MLALLFDMEKKVIYKYRYSLNKENIYDMQVEAAYSDKAIKKKMMILLLNFLLIPSAIVVIVMKNKFIALIIAILYFFICLFIFPSVYWNRIRKIIMIKLDKTNFKFDELFIEFTDTEVSVIQKGNKLIITYDQVDGYRITNHNFILYYHQDGKNDCLIVPYLIIENELDSIIGVIKDKIKAKEELK